MRYDHLNQLFIDTDGAGYPDAWKRTLMHLGDYVALIVRALNMRPTRVALAEQTARYALVRISMPSEHLVLRVAPEADLANEVYFGRMMLTHQLPAARIIQRDVTRTLVPFAYTLERYVCGVGADTLVEAHLLRSVARQAGRVLRRMHRTSAAGWGGPGPTGRWPDTAWLAMLKWLHTIQAPPPTDALIFDAAEREIVAALIDDPLLDVDQPRLIHGAPGPHTVRCTTSADHVQLEAIVDPGPMVAGDPMIDLAWGLNPGYPAAWRSGLLEGYTSIASLNAYESNRLQLLLLLTAYWSACQLYAHAEDHEPAYRQAKALLHTHQSREGIETAVGAARPHSEDVEL